MQSNGHNVSMDNAMHEDDAAILFGVDRQDHIGTPKKRQELGPIFDETEFGPSGTAPRVQESALV